MAGHVATNGDTARKNACATSLVAGFIFRGPGPSAGDDHNAESNSNLSRPGNGRVGPGGPVICSLPVFHS